MKVLIAPDSFKGSLGNIECAQAIAEGWLTARPDDHLTLLPMADGGEGTLETIARHHIDAIRVPIHLSRESSWLLLQDGTAVVELAEICGITHLAELDPMNANTFELGIILKVVAQDPRVTRLMLTVGGSASTDGGVGALIAMGAHFKDVSGKPIALGGIGLAAIKTIDLGEVSPAPKGGVICLVDVTSPLLGEEGSARVFAPQKGANETQVRLLEIGLSRLQEVSGHEDFPGAGAAGGTPFGLSLAWDIKLESGALAIASTIGLHDAIADADLIITGEGRLDEQSHFGKVVGVVTSVAKQFSKRILYCVGGSATPLNDKGVALLDFAPSFEAAMDHPKEWLMKAGAELARRESN